MKLVPGTLSCLIAALSTLCAAGQLSTQALSAPAATSVGPQAVKVVLKHFVINPFASDPSTQHPLRSDGSWSFSKNRPASCPQVPTCVEVFYAVPAQSAKCSWVIALDETSTDGTIVDENSDADTYMVRTLKGPEIVPFIKSRIIPAWAPIAKAAGVSGVVVVSVLVGKSGEVLRTPPVSGPPMLIPTCVDAAKKWSFVPMTVGARPVQYQVQLVFTFNSLTGKVKAEP